MAYKRAELVLHYVESEKVVGWAELPEEDERRMARAVNSWLQYMARTTPCPPGAKFKVRFDYMSKLIPKGK